MSIDESVSFGADIHPQDLLPSHALCVSGATLPLFMATPQLKSNLHNVSVFARIAPDQKASLQRAKVCRLLRQSRRCVAFCGRAAGVLPSAAEPQMCCLLRQSRRYREN